MSRPRRRWPTGSTSARTASSRSTISAAARSTFRSCKLHDGIFEVLATNGDTHLGGDDIDNLLLHIALEDIASEWGEDVSTDSEGVQLLRRAVIQAKEQLSFVPAATIELEYRGKKYQREIKRELFDQLITPIVDRTLGPCRDLHQGRGRHGRADQRSGDGGRVDAHSAGAVGGREAVPRASRIPN